MTVMGVAVVFVVILVAIAAPGARRRRGN